MYEGSLKKEKRRRGIFLPLGGLDLLVSLLLLREWKSKKESVGDPEAQSCGPHIVCHREVCMADNWYHRYPQSCLDPPNEQALGNKWRVS